MKNSDQKIRQFIFVISSLCVALVSPHVFSISSANIDDGKSLFTSDVNTREIRKVLTYIPSPTDPKSGANTGAEVGITTPVEDMDEKDSQAGANSAGGENVDGDLPGAVTGERTTPCRNCTLEKTNSYRYAQELLKGDDLSAKRKAELAKILDGIANDSADINQRTSDIAAAVGRLTSEEEGNEKRGARGEEETETNDKEMQALNEKTIELEKKIDESAKSLQSLAQFFTNMLSGGGQSVADASDEMKAELKEMHSKVRETQRAAWKSNAIARANVEFMITAYERRLKKLRRSGAGDSDIANQARENVEGLKKALVNLEQQKGRIILSKRDANDEFTKSNATQKSGLLSFFTPSDVMDDINYKRMKRTAERLDAIGNDLADIEAFATSVEAIVSGNGGAQDLQAIDGWLAVYKMKNQEASPNANAYDARGELVQDNSFLTPAIKGPKFINGSPI